MHPTVKTCSLWPLFLQSMSEETLKPEVQYVEGDNSLLLILWLLCSPKVLCHQSSVCFSVTRAYVRVVLSCCILRTFRCPWPALCRPRVKGLQGGRMGCRLVCFVPAWVSKVRYKWVHMWHAVMLILTCCYLFLYFFAVIPWSPSMLRFGLLQPCDLISLTDPGCLGKVSLSTVPFLLKFTLSVTNSFWHLSKCSALCRTGLYVSSHSRVRTHARTDAKCTETHTGACKDTHRHKNTVCTNKNTHWMWLKSRTHNIPQAHVLWLTPFSPRYPHCSTLSGCSSSFHA